MDEIVLVSVSLEREWNKEIRSPATRINSTYLQLQLDVYRVYIVRDALQQLLQFPSSVHSPFSSPVSSSFSLNMASRSSY